MATIKRLVQSQVLPMDVALRQSVEHMERLEALAQRSGKTVKEVAVDPFTGSTLMDRNTPAASRWPWQLHSGV